MLLALIREHGLSRVVDIGGGATPLLPVEEIRKHNLDYSILDISQAELSKAPAEYNKICADICTPLATINQVDLACSEMLAEHVEDPESFHRNVFAMLRPGGFSVHIFPTLYSLPFIANRLLPEEFLQKTLRLVQPSRAVSKFPAYYRWCRGPMNIQVKRLKSVGFEVVDYVGLFGHSYYLRMPWLHRANVKTSEFFVSHPVAALTSFACIILRKPQ